MSVVLMDDLENAGRNVTELINDPDDFALAAITAGSARMNKQKSNQRPTSLGTSTRTRCR